MAEKRLRTQHSKSDVGGLTPLLEHGGVAEVVGPGPSFNQRHDHLRNKKLKSESEESGEVVGCGSVIILRLGIL